MFFILKRLIFTFLLIISLFFCYNYIFEPLLPTTPLTIEKPPVKMRILLVPLDSRPPCRKFVEDVAKIAGIEIISPPSDFLDYYTIKGNAEKLRVWTEEHIQEADGAILAIDQLLHGGLIASRENPATKKEEQELLSFLKRLRMKKLYIPIYVFSIMPRLTPPNSITDEKTKKDLMEWSRLQDYYTTFPSKEILERLTILEKNISRPIRERYLQTYLANTALNQDLIKLVKENYLSHLVIGQDDSEPYGIPNIEKRKILNLLQNDPIIKNKVQLSHGADELALTCLAGLYGEIWRHNFTVFVEYNDETKSKKIMPYMAINLHEVVDDKLALIGATKAPLNDAELILLVSCVNEENLYTRKKTAEKIKKYIKAGYDVALVDLSEHFDKAEMVFPFLIETKTPLQGLVAYAAWNTTGNAVGTALSEAYIFSLARKHATTKEDVISVYAANLEFLNNRYLEDYYYLKKNIDQIKEQLQKALAKNITDIDTMRDYHLANDILQKTMQKEVNELKSTKAFKLPIEILTPRGKTSISIKDIGIDTKYPWPRTFEIYLSSTLWLQEHYK